MNIVDWATAIGTATGVAAGVSLAWVTVMLLLWPQTKRAIKAVVGGTVMGDFARRVTSREFLAFGFVGVYAIIITVGGYEVPKYVSEVIVPAILLFGGFMAVTGRNKSGG